MLGSNSFLFPHPNSSSEENGNFFIKRKRRPAGTPDPDAQVVYLTAEMLMESDRYVCEICNLSFQREQNLQMHRRRHKVPWKLKKKEEENNINIEEQQVKKRVYVCPEPSCVHHDPSHALGDLVGIKKHFRRKHSNYKQWVCEKCCKGYAVQSDYKAHIKTCGTRGHSCDCGRVFSRVETFIEHQGSCKAKNTKACDIQKPNKTLNPPHQISNSNDQNYSRMPKNNNIITHPNLELELFTPPNIQNYSSSSTTTFLGQSQHYYQDQQNNSNNNSIMEETSKQVLKLKSEAKEIMKIAMEQKAKAAEKRQEAKCLIELANLEMAKAREIKQQLFLSQYYSNNIATTTNNNNIHVMQYCSCCNKQFQTVSNEVNYFSPNFYKR